MQTIIKNVHLQQDLSRNGTYINREKLGLKRKRILAHNDVISVSNPAYKTFVYKDQRRNLYDLPEVITSKYHVGRKLGAGASGTVYHVHNYQTCNAYALKHIKKNLLVDLKTEKAMNEAKIMKSLKHPCVVQMNDIIDTPDSVFIMLELMHGGDLLTRIQRCSYLSEDLSKLSFYQICHAIKYLHDRNVTHRDLKPDNILLATKDDETLVKVSDFGLSKLVQNNSVMKTLCGTPLYVAPEVLQTNGRGEYSEKVDVWSLGVVLFTCLSGTLPFANEYGSPATEQIKHGRFKFISPNWKNVSEVAKKFVCEILTIDVEKRPSIDKVLQHPWLADDYGMLCKAHKLMDLPPPPAPIVKIPRARIIDRQTIFAKPKPFEVGKISSELTNIIENSPLQLQPPPKRRRLCWSSQKIDKHASDHGIYQCSFYQYIMILNYYIYIHVYVTIPMTLLLSDKQTIIPYILL